MERIFRFFISNYRFTFSVLLFFVFAGLLGLKTMKRETFPPVDFAKATIVTIYPGSSPEEVEEKITKKIEDEIRTVDGIRDVRSISQSGRSDIYVRVDMDNVDTKVVMDDLQRAVQRVNGLPAGILDDPLFMTINSKEIPIIEMGIVGKLPGRMRDQIADDFKTTLEDIKGVSTVRFVGFREREFQVLLNKEKLENNHVGISEVYNAVSKHSKNVPAGYIRDTKRQMLVRVQGQIKTIEEMSNIIIRSNFSGQQIKVKDIAKVFDGAVEPSSLVRLNGKPATLLVISKKENADTIKTVNKLMNSINKFKKTLPKELSIAIYNNESDRVTDRLNIVINNAIGGLTLVVIFLLMFLPGILGIMTSMSLPITVLATVAILTSMGINFNTMTMLAFIISIGMLVDNSVVISENYARLRQEGMDRYSAAVKSGFQFWLPITGTALTTVAAFVPMLVTRGILGQFIKLIPIVVSISLLVSLFESFFLLPARLQFTINYKNDGKKKTNWFDFISSRFEKFMLKAVTHRYIALFTVSLLILGSLALAIFGNRFELFPAEDVEFYHARVETQTSSRLTNTDRIIEELRQKVEDVLGAKTLSYQISRVGVARIGMSDPQEKNGDYVGMITFRVPRKIAKTQDMQEVLKRLRKITHPEIAKLSFEGQAPGPPVGKAINITFRSNKYGELKGMVGEFKIEFDKLKGVVDLSTDIIKGGSEYNIDLNFDKLAKYNLTTESVGVSLRTALQGAVASELNIDNKEVDLRIRYDDADKSKIDHLKQTKVMEPSSLRRTVPLEAVAQFKEIDGPEVRKHLDYLRSITISGNVIPEVITSIEVNKQAAKIIDKIKNRYKSVTVTFGGEQESTKDSVQSLLQAMIIAIFAIFMILVFLFDSFSKPLLVLTSIPLGLIGVSLAFFVHDKPLGFLALIGVVGLAGVAVNSAIVLVSFIDQLRVESPELSLIEVLAKASSKRLRAVVVTSLTTVGGLIPTAYGIGGSDPILVPMTLAIAWGLVSGTILTILWVPCGYIILEDISFFGRKTIKRLFLKRTNV